MLAVNLTSEIEELLDAVAKQTGQTSSEFVRAAILEKLEDTEDYLVAVERVRTMGKTVPLEDVLAEFADDLDANP
jgi:RHH-type rel operon transcriptional repressor/antitoxin RelB